MTAIAAYYLVAYRNPGFLEQPSEPVIAQDNNVEITIAKPQQNHFKHLSTENEENEEADSQEKKTASEKNNNKKINQDENAEEVSQEEIMVFENRYCTVCCIEQPLRAKHCRECGKCVALHDHHCPWLGLCIGEKNRFYFWWYLFFENILLWTSEIMLGLSFTNTSGWYWIAENWGKLAVMVIVSFFTIMVTCLLGYHTFLALVNQSTWENVSWEKISYMKLRERKYGSPFSRGILGNLWFYCCKKYPETYTVWNVKRISSIKSI